MRSLRKTLKKLSEPPVTLTLEGLVRLCHEMRGAQVDGIKKRSRVAQDDFGCLAHYIGRLGATRSSVRTVVRAMNIVPALRHISDIRIIDAPGVRPLTMSAEDMIPSEIVRGISQDSAAQNAIDIGSALHALVDVDHPSTDGSQNHLRTKLVERRTIVTRVHAELQMADRFSRDGFEFVDNDKYIGCSKPACYFCYNWLSCHRHVYVPPATHQKIIPCCRGPDNAINESGAAILKDMYRKMNLQIGQDILDLLLQMHHTDKPALPENRYMSTDGTSRAPSMVSTAFRPRPG